MIRNKEQMFYIFSLLVLASLLVLFAQGVFAGISAGSKEHVVEITRIDMFNEFVGNYSILSVLLVNNDTISHNFSIDVFYDEKLVDSLNLTVDVGSTYSHRRNVLPDRIPISETETINSTLRVAKFVVYMDDQPQPIKETSFIF